MSTPTKVLLLLGAGPRLGLSILKHFSANGYKTASVSRSPTAELSKQVDLALTADFAKPETLEGVFEEVRGRLGVPSVVVYNAAAYHPTPTDAFSLSIAEFVEDTNINVISAYAAMQHSITGFRSLPKEVQKTFIYTGNGLTHFVLPVLFSAGIGKRGAAALVDHAVHVYRDEGFRFYYADERKANGKPVYGDVSGENHGQFYLELAEKKEQGPWEATFVGGVGYKDFEGGIGA